MECCTEEVNPSDMSNPVWALGGVPPACLARGYVPACTRLAPASCARETPSSALLKNHTTRVRARDVEQPWLYLEPAPSNASSLSRQPPHPRYFMVCPVGSTHQDGSW